MNYEISDKTKIHSNQNEYNLSLKDSLKFYRLLINQSNIKPEKYLIKIGIKIVKTSSIEEIFSSLKKDDIIFESIELCHYCPDPNDTNFFYGEISIFFSNFEKWVINSYLGRNAI